MSLLPRRRSIVFTHTYTSMYYTHALVDDLHIPRTQLRLPHACSCCCASFDCSIAARIWFRPIPIAAAADTVMVGGTGVATEPAIVGTGVAPTAVVKPAVVGTGIVAPTAVVDPAVDATTPTAIVEPAVHADATSEGGYFTYDIILTRHLYEETLIARRQCLVCRSHSLLQTCCLYQIT